MKTPHNVWGFTIANGQRGKNCFFQSIAILLFATHCKVLPAEVKANTLVTFALVLRLRNSLVDGGLIVRN